MNCSPARMRIGGSPQSPVIARPHRATDLISRLLSQFSALTRSPAPPPERRHRHRRERVSSRSQINDHVQPVPRFDLAGVLGRRQVRWHNRIIRRPRRGRSEVPEAPVDPVCRQARSGLERHDNKMTARRDGKSGARSGTPPRPRETEPGESLTCGVAGPSTRPPDRRPAVAVLPHVIVMASAGGWGVGRRHLEAISDSSHITP